MSSNSDFAPPGTSTYASDTMYVGDGTWDKSRNTFLLPNLVGLNFDTMVYNGMGNRFREMAGYYPLIVAHGVIAAIVFLGLVPTSILIIRYYRDRYWALKLHIWFQVLTLLLTTVVFMLGWFAVGPQRSLSNPHHGIGLAIYVLVIFQALWGWLVHRLEDGKKRLRIPLKVMVHQWLGRALAILGIVQVPLGLTLYGSPLALFILYAVIAFIFLATFFFLSYLYGSDSRGTGSDYDSNGSYDNGPSVVDDKHHTGLGRTAAAAAAGAGLTELFRRRSRRKTEAGVEDESHTSYIDEKYSDESRQGGWGKGLLGIGVIGGAAMLIKGIFDRRRRREADTESGRYRPTHTRSDSYTEESMSRIEDGHPGPSGRHPYGNRPPTVGPSHDSMDYSYSSQTEGGRGHGIRDAVLGAGAFATIRNIFTRRRERDEQRRVDEIRRRDYKEEKMTRANSKRKYTGDGFFPRRARPSDSMVSSDMSSDLTPRPPRGAQGPSGLSTEPVVSGAVNNEPLEDIPPIPPAHRPLSTSATPSDLEGIAGGAAGAALASSAGHHRRRRTSSSRRRGDEHLSSPPVSVKVKMHNDGRHVTLRRLTEEERRRDRRNSRRRHTSVSSLSDAQGGNDRWRRLGETESPHTDPVQGEQGRVTEAAAAPNASAITAPSASAPRPGPSMTSAPTPAPDPVPSLTASALPPPAPPSNIYGAGSVASPGTYTGTEMSGDFENNRRRRRAERAQARMARQQPGP